MSEPAPRYDVALSFAGEDRAYVDEIAMALRDRGVKVYYDQFVVDEMWGEDLGDLLDDVYRNQARFVIMFVSEAYARKVWTRHERRSAQARAIMQESVYILPIRLDQTELQGLRPTISYLDAAAHTTGAVSDFVLRKLGRVRLPPQDSFPSFTVPKDRAEVLRLLGDRPSHWGWALFAGLLAVYRDAEAGKWEAHLRNEIFRESDNVEVLRPAVAWHRLQDERLRMLRLIADHLSPALASGAVQRAIDNDDAEEIEQVVANVMSVYSSLLDWADRVRSLGLPPEFSRAQNLLVSYATFPIEGFHVWIDRASEIVETLPELLLEQGGVQLKLTLVPSLDDHISSELDSELARLREGLQNNR